MSEAPGTLGGAFNAAFARLAAREIREELAATRKRRT